MVPTKSATAMLIMDVQTMLLNSLPSPDSLKKTLAEAVAEARKRQIPVIYVVVGFRPGLPEIGGNNKSFAGRKDFYATLDMDKWMEIDPSVKPEPGEVIVVKKRYSAFAGSDLEMILRSLEIKHLILAGIVTGGVVLSTLREASDKDFALTVLSDCCADRDEEVHRVLITKLFPRQADVLTFEEWKNS